VASPKQSALSISLLLAVAAMADPVPAPITPGTPAVAVAAAIPAPSLSGSDKVGPVILRDETVSQVIELLQRWTGKTVLRPQALPANTFNLSLPEGATRDEALQALETLLSLNGCAVIAQGDKFLKVVPNAVARTETPALIAGSTLELAPSGRVGAKIFHLNFIPATEFLTQLASTLNSTLGAAPIVFNRTNSILITDSISNLQRIEGILKELDRPKLDFGSKVYTLEHANAADVVRKLTTLLSGPLSGRLSSGTTFSSDDRTNRVILLGDPRQQTFFDGLVAQLDVRSDPNTHTEVLPLRHANAPDIATLLTQLVTGQKTARAGAAAANANRRTTTPAAQANAATPATPAAAVAAATEQGGADEFSQSVTVVADTRSNALVVSGTTDDLRLLKDLVDRIDILLAQVRIEVVIAEVTLTDNASSGLDQLGLTVTGSKLTGFSGAGAGLNVTNGSVFRTPSGDNDLSATIGLTSTPRKSDTNILSNPSITTTHNKEATIFVCESRPVVTGTTSTPGATTGITTSSTVTQRDIGIQLKVLPLIGKDGAVQLQVQQSVEDILGTVLLDGNEQPRIGRRTTESFVSAKSGEIIVLGGLQRSQLTKSKNRLGPIAWIGDLLGGSKEEETKTELIIFLRPYVLTGTPADNADALRRVDDTVHKEAVRSIFDNKPGSPESSSK
jgi:general secretion pathway protein D